MAPEREVEPPIGIRPSFSAAASECSVSTSAASLARAPTKDPNSSFRDSRHPHLSSHSSFSLDLDWSWPPPFPSPPTKQHPLRRQYVRPSPLLSLTHLNICIIISVSIDFSVSSLPSFISIAKPSTVHPSADPDEADGPHSRSAVNFSFLLGFVPRILIPHPHRAWYLMDFCCSFSIRILHKVFALVVAIRMYGYPYSLRSIPCSVYNVTSSSSVPDRPRHRPRILRRNRNSNEYRSFLDS